MLCSRSLTATCTWKRFMVFSFPGGRAGGTRTATATAVLREVTDEFIHVLEIGAVDDEAAFGTAAHEAGAREVREMERERGGRQLELLANQPRRQSCGSGFDQQAVDLETSFLCQGSERVDRLCHFHISRIMETTWRCQCAASARPRWRPRRRARASPTARLRSAHCRGACSRSRIAARGTGSPAADRKSTRLNSS